MERKILNSDEEINMECGQPEIRELPNNKVDQLLTKSKEFFCIIFKIFLEKLYLITTCLEWHILHLSTIVSINFIHMKYEPL